jgi:hypothetical protein
VRIVTATGQGSAESNEDISATGPGIAIVLDGVSQWYTTESGCIHGTVWYVNRLSDQVLHHAAQQLPLTEAVTQAITDVAQSHQDTCDLTHPWSPAATVAVLRETETHVEYLLLADCVIVLETDIGVTALTDTRLAELLQRVRHPNASEEMKQHLRDGLHRLRNHPDGYWVASADPAAGGNAVTGCIARNEIRRAALLTDGASCLVDDYGRATWAQLLDLGPDGVIGGVRRWEKSDPDRVRWRRGKVHDDATAVFCDFRSR